VTDDDRKRKCSAARNSKANRSDRRLPSTTKSTRRGQSIRALTSQQRDAAGAGYVLHLQHRSLASIANESVVNPVLGVSDFGPWASNMTARDYFQGPGAWNLDLGRLQELLADRAFAASIARGGLQRLQPRELAYYSNFIGQYGPNPVGFAPGTPRNMQFTLRLIF
jgi:hypothetical protein